MKYRGDGINIYSSENIDPEFVKYLYSLELEFIQELYIVWKRHNNKIQDIEIDRLANELKQNKIDLTKIFGGRNEL